MKRAELWLTYAWNDSFGAYLAIASTLHPSRGDREADVVASCIQRCEEDVLEWFETVKLSRSPQSS
jgi:hypothetical protein